jgi:hypothetical protein
MPPKAPLALCIECGTVQRHTAAPSLVNMQLTQGDSDVELLVVRSYYVIARVRHKLQQCCTRCSRVDLVVGTSHPHF